MGTENNIADKDLGRRKPASAQEIKVTTAPESTLGLEVMAWMEVHRQKLVIAGGVILVAVIVGVVYDHFANSRELQASEALLALRPPLVGDERTKPVSSDKYQALLDQYSGTAAAQQALFLKGEALYLEAKYDQSRTAFQDFMNQNPGHALSSQAELGMAACLDAAGKTKEAQDSYDMVRKRYPQDNAVVSQAKLALGRLHEDQGQQEPAYTLYKELTENMRFGYNSYMMEARERMLQMEKLNPKLIELRQAPKPVITPVTATPGTNAAPAPIKVVPAANAAPAPAAKAK